MEVIRKYNSVQEFVNQAKRESVDSVLERASRTNPASPEWDFSIGWEGALQLAETGWKEGAQKIKEVLDKVANILKPDTFEQEVKYDVTGAFIDVGAYLNGEPNCFGSFSPLERPHKTIHVVVNCTISYAIPANAAMNRGAAVAAAIDVLERRGYRVELDLITVWQKGWGKGDKHIAIIRAKDAGQPVDLDRMAFCITHPAFLRRIDFGVCETENESVRKFFEFHSDGGYGYPTDHRLDTCELYFAKTFAGEDHYFVTAESSAEWVKDKLVKANLVDFERRA